MYQMKKGGSSKPIKKMQGGGSSKAAPKAMSMKDLKKKYPDVDTTATGDVRGTEMNAYAPKKVLQKYNDTYNAFDKKFKKGPSYKNGGSIGTSKKTKMAMGGSLKDVPADKVGLSKLPTAVRNKMGYKQMGGSTSSSSSSSKNNMKYPSSSTSSSNSSFSNAAKSALSNAASTSNSSTTSSKPKMTGVTSPEQSNILSKVPAAGAARASKQKERSSDGNYAKISKTRETPAGTRTVDKTRRTVQGILRGAPRVANYKKGGMVGKSKKK